VSSAPNTLDTRGLELDSIPIFPLPEVVLFPRALLPLHIFEPRYRAMLKDCLNSHRTMAIALILDGDEIDTQGHPRIAEVAGIGVIREHQELPDGRSNIVLEGRARVRLEELPFAAPYRRAKARVLEDVPTDVTADDRMALFAAAMGFASEVRLRDAKFSFSVPQSLEPAKMADLCAHHLILDAGVRQAVLEEADINERVRRVIGELAAQHSALLREGGVGLN
jgi:Lon protease-like protein